MERPRKGGWIYIMANRYRGTIYVGVTSDLAARIYQQRSGDGSDFCAPYGLDRWCGPKAQATSRSASSRKNA